MDRTAGVITRRAFAVLASVLLGLAGVVATGSPAAAATTVTGACQWDPAASEWVVDWTITPDPPAGATSYQVLDTDHGRAASAKGFADSGAAADPLTGQHRLPADADAASVAISAEWRDRHGMALADEIWAGQVTIPADCTAPDTSDYVTGFTYDCQTLTIRVGNPADEPVRLTFAATSGEPFAVEVASGEEVNVRFPALDGQSVDVQLDGRSIVDPAEPIEITKAQWAALDCDDTEPGGEAADLAATGSRVALVAIGALALLGLGGGLYLVARRRRIRFTA